MRTVAVFCVFLCAGASAAAQCHPRPYRTGAIYVNDASMVVKSISIPMQDFAPGKLVCLATGLRARYRDRSNILIYIFGSHAASRQSILVGEISKEDYQTYAQIHALYSFDASRHEEYIKILPVGIQPPRIVSTEGPYSTRINLPVVAEPHCQMEINNRCLIALKDIVYPEEALKQRASGKVALTALIDREGMVKRVHAVTSEGIESETERLLSDATSKNLASWRFEPGMVEEIIHITYWYAIDSSLNHVDGVQVRWALPNEVTIRSSPY